MTGHSTTRELAQVWCLTGSIPRPVRRPDETLSIITVNSLHDELEVAARCYHEAAERDAESVFFAVRDRRAQRARIAEGLRARGVPIRRVPGVSPREDPVVDELLQLATVLLQVRAGREPEPETRNHLAARTDTDVPVDEVLERLGDEPTLHSALTSWVVETDLVDRLLREQDGIHHRGASAGTVGQRASAENLDLVLEVARSLDTANAATSGYPSFGPNELAAAIEEGVMGSRQPLYPTADGPTTVQPSAELVQMAELKLAGEADVVVALELTKTLLDDDPGEFAFSAVPELGRHPDTPGITRVTAGRASDTFGLLRYISDGKRAWFVGLGRRHLGNALAAASDRAVLVARQGGTGDLSTTPSRTIVELQEVLCLEPTPASALLSEESSVGPADAVAADNATSAPPSIDELLARLREDLEAVDEADEPSDDHGLRDAAERLTDAVRHGTLSVEQLRAIVETLARHRLDGPEPTTDGGDAS